VERFQYFDAIIRDIRAREASYGTPLLEPPAAPPNMARWARLARR